jgi:hypothetical protein
MSYLESGKGRFRWIPGLTRASQRRPPGCAQCGSGLDADRMKPNLTGKCDNCTDFVTDDEDSFDDLED